MSDILSIRDLSIQGKPPDGSWMPIARNINMTVKSGEVVALIGESGAGKSTIGLAALGYTRPGCRFAGGDVDLAGTNLLPLTTKERQDFRGKTVAYVAQSAAAGFNPSLTINRQVTEAPVYHRVFSPPEARDGAVVLYRQLALPEPESIGDRYPHQVSGGQLQRLMTAMAMSCEPGLLVMDEPTTALDVTTQIEVLVSIKNAIRETNTAAIYITHDLTVVAQIADRTIVLLNGEIVDQGTTRQIITAPSHEYTKSLISAVKPSPRQTVEATEREERMEAGAKTQHMDMAAIIKVDKVSAAYGDKVVLKDVDLKINSGRTVAVVGESGCGKSTLARVISGLKAPSKGRILYNGSPLSAKVRHRNRDETRRIQMIFQIPDVALNPRHLIREILGRPLSFFLGMDANQRKERIAELLEIVELPANFEGRFPGELSGGQKQRIGIARALAAEPDVILCDEVTSALDTVVGAAVLDLMQQLQRKLGIAYVFISHDLSTVAHIADDVAVLYAGQVVERGPKISVFKPPYHPYTRLLLRSVPELRPGWLEETTATKEATSGIAKSVEITTKGCAFFSRCPLAIEGTCNVKPPPMLTKDDAHVINCHVSLAELDASTHSAPQAGSSN